MARARLGEAETSVRPTFVREIILENFMSHEYSRIRLEPGLNVITGPNGSGKSSILLGLAVALGQTYTERGARLSDLIRRGKEAARLTVILDNSPVNGERPFRHIKSDEIAITRYIKKNGEYWHYVNNRFTPKAELEELLRGLGINPNNALIIMHQNMIENFAARDDVEKLRAMEDAVGIASLRERIMDAEARLNSLRSEEASVKRLLAEAGEAVEYWRRELQKLQQLRSLEERKNSLELEYAWSLANQVLRSLERKRSILERLLREREGLEQEAERLGREAGALRGGIRERLYGGGSPEEVLELVDSLVSVSVEEGIRRYRIGELSREITEAQSEIESLSRELEERREAARQRGGEVPTTREPSDILEELKMVTLNIASLGKVTPDAEAMFFLADSRFKEVEARARQLEENVRRALEEVERRRQVWREKLEEILENINPVYQRLLEAVGGRGMIRIRGLDDPPTARLELFAGFRGMEPTLVDARTHSGGERVVSTLAFLLALQSYVKSPIRAVDEFDVHLDPLNREMVTRILVEMAKANPTVQFLFITPGRIPVTDGVNLIITQNVGGSSFVTSMSDAT
ncbi:MAG: AAA family ATPase [Candidatus Caldarchaeales archaeon]|nr:AAA family ATPase [Candidatus Caldarchaeales archaeon]MDT7915225.1 AAA family ATPase [Candidatus Caldarchaeales archaeon]